ncbi:MAG TPA: SprB repeat-containing protein, partial [Flavobacteriales bacterium]|nr:SprB repeat-containing protein [Flavobacteriales bacterium]
SNGETTVVADSLSSGIYVVNVEDSKGCYNFALASVNDAQAPNVVVNNVGNVTCYGNNDGFIDINVIGSTAPYSYQWSNGATTQDIGGLEAGPYEVIVTDANGCRAVRSITVSEPGQVTVSFV